MTDKRRPKGYSDPERAVVARTRWAHLFDAEVDAGVADWETSEEKMESPKRGLEQEPKSGEELGADPIGTRRPIGADPIGTRRPIGADPIGTRRPIGADPIGTRRPIGADPIGTRRPIGADPIGTRRPIGADPIGTRRPIGADPIGADRADPDAWAESLTEDDVLRLMRELGVTEIALKVLSGKQDNDKNQIYLGMDLAGAASRIPSINLRGSVTSSRKVGARGKTLYQADVDFHWLTSTGPARAPEAKLIFYPQYPEVRLSGLIRRCSNPPRTYYVKKLSAQTPGRVLVLGVSGAATYALLLPPSAPAARSLAEMRLPCDGVLRLLRVRGDVAMSTEDLLAELHGVHLRGFVPGCRISRGKCVEYWANPAIGATLEAHLGVETNARSEPDFAGWELKTFGVSRLDPVTGGSPLTLFTQEPDGGLYRADFQEFMRRYGYENPTRPGRLTFAGTQRVGQDFHTRTGLRLVLRGVDGAVADHDPDGYIALVDRDGAEAATWSFLSLLDHWRAKHARCVFVPAAKDSDRRAYRFGATVTLAEGATFLNLLSAIHEGRVYYDPGCWLTVHEDGSYGRSKRRNQWRVKREHIPSLYDTVESADATRVAPDNTVSSRALSRLGIVLPTLETH